MPEGFKKILYKSGCIHIHILKVWKLFLWDFWLTCIGLFRSFSGEVRNLEQQVFDLKSNFLFLLELFPVLYPPVWIYRKQNLGQIPSRIFIMCLHMSILTGHASLPQFITLESNAGFFSGQDWCQHDIDNIQDQDKREGEVLVLCYNKAKRRMSLQFYG